MKCANETVTIELKNGGSSQLAPPPPKKALAFNIDADAVTHTLQEPLSTAQSHPSRHR